MGREGMANGAQPRGGRFVAVYIILFIRVMSDRYTSEESSPVVCGKAGVAAAGRGRTTD